VFGKAESERMPVRPCNKSQGRLYTKGGKNIYIEKRRKK